MPELIARVRLRLEDSGTVPASRNMHCADMQLDPEAHRVTLLRGQLLDDTPDVDADPASLVRRVNPSFTAGGEDCHSRFLVAVLPGRRSETPA